MNEPQAQRSCEFNLAMAHLRNVLAWCETQVSYEYCKDAIEVLEKTLEGEVG